jgi:hypothetical protein
MTGICRWEREVRGFCPLDPEQRPAALASDPWFSSKGTGINAATGTIQPVAFNENQDRDPGADGPWRGSKGRSSLAYPSQPTNHGPRA